MSQSIELLRTIIEYLDNGGSDLKSLNEGLRTRLLPMVKKELESSSSSSERPEGDASTEEYAALVPEHKNWKGEPIPTRTPFKYNGGGRKGKLEIDWKVEAEAVFS